MIELPQELKTLLEDKNAVKILGTVDGDGIPHVVFKDSITLLEDGTLAYAEELDSSQANKNMVRGIWFDKLVSITVGKADKCYQVKARPVKCAIVGPLFSRFLARAKEQRGADADVQSVWIVAPVHCRNQSREVRLEEERKKDPYYNVHLDRLKATG
jgi:hypothetical protein